MLCQSYLLQLIGVLERKCTFEIRVIKSPFSKIYTKQRRFHIYDESANKILDKYYVCIGVALDCYMNYEIRELRADYECILVLRTSYCAS